MRNEVCWAFRSGRAPDRGQKCPAFWTQERVCRGFLQRNHCGRVRGWTLGGHLTERRRQASSGCPRLREDWTQDEVSSGIFSMKSSGVRGWVRNLARGRRGRARARSPGAVSGLRTWVRAPGLRWGQAGDTARWRVMWPDRRRLRRRRIGRAETSSGGRVGKEQKRNLLRSRQGSRRTRGPMGIGIVSPEFRGRIVPSACKSFAEARRTSTRSELR